MMVQGIEGRKAKNHRERRSAGLGRVVLLLTIATAVLLTACGGGQTQQQAQSGKVDLVSLQFDWVPMPRYMPFYVANDKGFYKENGLAVHMTRGSGSITTAQAVDQKQVTFGVADAGPIVKMYTEGLKSKAIFLLGDKSGAGISSYTAKTAKEMEGKRLGVAAGAALIPLLPLFAKTANFDLSKVTIVNMAAGAIFPAMFRGEVDLASTWKDATWPGLAIEAKKAGKTPNLLLLADAGVDIYGHVVIAHNDTIAKNPDLVKRFVAATVRGAQAAMEKPAEALDILLKYHPELQKDLADAQWKMSMENMTSPVIKQNGYGFMTDEKWKRTVDMMAEAMKFSANIPLKDIYTNEFLPAKK